MVMKKVKDIRQDRADDLEAFNELRREFADLSSRFANNSNRTTADVAGSRSMPGNRVTFKNEVKSSSSRLPYQQQQQQSVLRQRSNNNQLNSSVTLQRFENIHLIIIL